MDRRNGFSHVVTTDCSKYAPALYKSDVYYIVCKMDDPGYLKEILQICEKEKIDSILPLREEEILFLAKNKNYFIEKKIIPMVSDYNTIFCCKDKLMFAQRMKENGIPVIPTISSDDFLDNRVEYYFPVYIKPRYGAGSVLNSIVQTPNLLKEILKNNEEEYIIQPYISGQEYGVNAYVDYYSGKLIDCFLLKKIAMRAGETFKSVSVHDKIIEGLVERVCKTLMFKGPIDIDIMEMDGDFYILEVNPRFGGGYPHAYQCGVNFPALISKNTKGPIKCNKTDYKDDVVALRYTDILII